MTDKAKFRADLIRWLYTYEDSGLTEEELDSDEYDEFEHRLKEWACAYVGAHQPERDHCNRPEHDFCTWCGVLTPNQAPERGR